MTENAIGEKYRRKVTAAERFFGHSPFAIVTMVLRIKDRAMESLLTE